MLTRTVCLVVLSCPVLAPAADNQLTDAERKAGWKLLFDGKTFDGWMTSDSKPSQRAIEEGCINPHRCGAYMMVHKTVWSDFVLKLDFKQSPRCNSGVFFRTFSLDTRPGRDVGYNGLEVAIDDTKTAGYHDTGAIYDLVKPQRNAMKPAGQWNHLRLTCNDNLVAVEINGTLVSVMDLNQWTEKFKRPDRSDHKFDVAYKDHPRKGYIGLQDHGADIWFKNIKLRVLSD